MSDLLKQVGQAVREEEAAGERLDAWASELLRTPKGEAPAAAEAAAELERELGVERDAVRIAYAPLSEDAKARMATRIQAALPGASSRSVSASNMSASPASGRRLRRGRAQYLVPLFAAAAAAVLWFTAPGPEPLAFASYTLEVEGAVALERSEPAANADAPLRLNPGTALTLTLRPEQAVKGEVTLRVYVRSVSGLLPLEPRVEAAPSGALRLQLVPERAWPEAGSLVVIVGRKLALAQADELAKPGAHAPGEGYQRFEREFVSSR